VLTRGGALRVQAQQEGEGYQHIALIGPAHEVFTGEVSI
jgi:diaminopimelate epimerase